MRFEKELMNGLRRYPENWHFKTNDRFLVYTSPDGQFGEASSEKIKLVRPFSGPNRWAICLPWGIGQLSLRTHLAIEWMRCGAKIERQS